MSIGLWFFREVFQYFSGDVAEGDLCPGDPFLFVPFGVFFGVEDDGMGGVDSVRLGGEVAHHLDAVFVVLLR